MSRPRVWLITGASTGFGRAMTELILKNGDIAVATLRRPEMLSELSAQYSVDRLLVQKLDVTNAAEVDAAFARTKEQYGRLDVVFNNAAYGVVSEVEAAYGHEKPVRDMFDTNFWGATRVTQAAVKFFREVNEPGMGGRLLQVSSMSGVEGTPAIGLYVASKFALEGLSEALAKELDPSWNIKVTIIEPGIFITEGQSNMTVIEPLPVYSSSPASIVRQMLVDLQTKPAGSDPRKAVEAFYRLTSLPDPPLHFPIGKDAIEGIRRKAEGLIRDTNTYASWSEELEVTSEK
ncbi:hypothetical protein CERSUDRAFT_83583 [Gelatoporia subvermispora B]|uniref:NAD-P-binding protein n=1 Tax=Ceriporiopsis subvermispora (strain B) TaxID=914234 RepID=M2RH62_CERS8|nr:hypothetical protein CERSUDRAFT_83583 [Gelatoporia subvermispora B]